MGLGRLSRRFREFSKDSFHRVFLLGQKCGVDILPRHFYSSIPDVAELKRDLSWRAPSTMAGVPGADLPPQLDFVRQCVTPALQERLRQGGIHQYACQENGEGGFGPVEADFLYCFIHTLRSRRIVQIGAGVSTAVILLAAKEAGYTLDLTCVDPFPTAYLRKMAHAGRIRLIPERAQVVDLAVFTDLGEGGLLFIDSTHTVKVGSEVNRLILEALPRLNKSAHVHVHDIYFPYDYDPGVLHHVFFPTESTLLHAFLACNARYTIRASLSMLHYGATDQLRALLPNYTPGPTVDPWSAHGRPGHFPASTYLQVIN